MDAKSIEFDSLLNVSREKAMKNREEARNYISIDLGNLARILSQYHPLEIIKMAYWEERRVARTTRDESIKEAARMMPVVLQSVVQSTLFKPHSYLRDVKKKDWARVQSICQDIQRKLNRYIDFQMVMEYIDGKVAKENLPIYRAAVHHQFFPEPANEEKLHMQTEFAKACLDGETPFFREKFGITCEHLGDEIEKLCSYSLNCIDRLRDDSSVHKTMLLLSMANLKVKAGNQDLSDEELRHKALKEHPELNSENQRLMGLRDDFDMFRPDFVSDLPSSFYKELSAEPGTLDMEDYLFGKGMWPSAGFPFIDFGGMYFTFMGKNLLGITQQVLKIRFNLSQRVAVATESILSSVLKPTDVLGVYSYEGEKIDVEVLCPLGEVNAYRFADLYQSRIERRKVEMNPRPALGHIALVLDPDGVAGIEKIDEGVFFTSLVHLLEIRNDRDERIRFYRFILPNAGLDKLADEELSLDDLDEDILAAPVEETSDDIQDEELTLDALDETETISDDVASDDLEDDEPAPEVSLYEVPEEEIRENERIYKENQSLIEEALEKQPVVSKDFNDKDLEEDYYQKDVPVEDDLLDDEDEDIDEEEAELEETLDEPETISDDAIADDYLEEDEEDGADDQLDLLEIFDDEDLVDDTDEDEVFADEGVISPVPNDIAESEIDTEKRDDEVIFKDEEETIAPVENDVLGEEIETEDRDDDDIEEESGDIPEARIVEPVRDDDVVRKEPEEVYEQPREKEKYVPDPAIMRKLFGLDDDDEKPEMDTPAKDEEDEANETVASFFGFDDESDTEEEPVDEPVAPSTENNAEFFGFDDEKEEKAPDETIVEEIPGGEAEEASPADEEEDRAVEDVIEDEGPTFVLDDPSLVEDTPAPGSVMKAEETPAVEEVPGEDAGFSLFDPADEEDEEAEPEEEEEPEAEEEEDTEDKSTSMLLGGSEVVVETPDAEDEAPAEEEETDEDQAELPLFDEPKEDAVQIPEMSDVVDLKDDDDEQAVEEVQEKQEESDEDLSGEGDALDGDIVLEYYDEEDKEEEEEEKTEAVSAEVVLSDEKEADARERVFTLSEEDVRESTASRTPVSAYIDPEVEEETKEEEESHTVDLGNPKYSETIRQIASLLLPDLGVFGSFIEKEDRSVLDYFNTVIKQCWERQCQDGKDKMFSIFEYDMSILLAKSKVYDALRENELMNNAGAVMYSKGKTEWNALILYVNKDYKVESVELRKISKDDFSASNWKIVTVIGEELISRGQR